MNWNTVTPDMTPEQIKAEWARQTAEREADVRKIEDVQGFYLSETDADGWGIFSFPGEGVADHAAALALAGRPYFHQTSLLSSTPERTVYRVRRLDKRR